VSPWRTGSKLAGREARRGAAVLVGGKHAPDGRCGLPPRREQVVCAGFEQSHVGLLSMFDVIVGRGSSP